MHVALDRIKERGDVIAIVTEPLVRREIRIFNEDLEIVMPLI